MRPIFLPNVGDSPFRLFDDPGDHNMNYCDSFEFFSDVAIERRNKGERTKKKLKMNGRK
jgi:hypothetical protein